VTVTLTVPPGATDRAVDETESVKPPVDETTLIWKVEVAVIVPEVPVIVAKKLPTVAVALALQVITSVVVVTGFVPKVQVTPEGRFETKSATLPVKPPTSLMVMVSVAVLP
jgi:hypothetical protein